MSAAAVSTGWASRRLLDDAQGGPVTQTTHSQGNVTALLCGPACVGAIACFVDSVNTVGRSLRRFNGALTSFVIPQ